MNRQIIKSFKAGIFAGTIGAIIEIIISAIVTKSYGQNIDMTTLVSGGATIGLITLVLTLIISSIIAFYKRKLQKF